MRCMNVIKAVAAIAVICTCTACSNQFGQENVDAVWAVEAIYKSAAQFSNHAGFVINSRNEVSFIDSGSNVLFEDLCISSDYYLRNYDADLLMFGYSEQFSGGVVKGVVTDSGCLKLSRSGYQEKSEQEDFMIYGQAGPYYIAAISDTTAALETNALRYASRCYGLMTIQNEWVLEPTFYEFSILSNGYCVLYDGLSNPYCILISPDGNYVQMDETIEINVSNGGCISSLDTEDPWLATKPQNVIPPPMIHQGNVQSWSGQADTSTDYIDKTGQIVLSVPYQNGKHFSEDLSAVKSGKRYGYIDRTGEMVIDADFTQADNFSEGLAAVMLNGSDTCSVINTSGEVVFDTSYVAVGIFHHQFSIVENKNGKYGVIDAAGKTVLSATYDAVLRADDIYLLKNGWGWGIYIPETGKIVAPQFEEMYFYGGDTLMIKKAGKYGLYSLKEEKFVKKPSYTAMDYMGEGIYNGITLLGNELIYEDGTVLFSTLHQCYFDSFEGFGDGVIPAMQNGMWGYLANPMIYTHWYSDASARAEEIGLQIPKGKNAITVQDFIGFVEQLIALQSEYYQSGKVHATWEAVSDFDVKDSISDDRNARITREQAAQVLTLLAQRCGSITEFYHNNCLDAEKVSEPYQDAVAYIVSTGIFETPNNHFYPQNTMSSEEVASVLLLFFEEMLDADNSRHWSATSLGVDGVERDGLNIAVQ